MNHNRYYHPTDDITRAIIQGERERAMRRQLVCESIGIALVVALLAGAAAHLLPADSAPLSALSHWLPRPWTAG